MNATKRQRRRLEQLRDRFIAATLRTRSLRLRRITRRGALDLSRLQRKERAAYQKIVAALETYEEGKSDDTSQAVALCDLKPRKKLEDFEADVSAIAHAAREERLESGTDDLAVGWPFVEGATEEGTWIRAPLLLFPVSVKTSESGRLQWRLRPAGVPKLNEPLVEFFAREQGFRMALDEVFGEQNFADASPGLNNETWCRLQESLRELGLPLEPKSVDLSKALAVATKHKEDRETAKNGQFTLVHHVVLGRFPVSASNVISDYDDMLGRDLEEQDLGAATELLLVDEDAPWEEQEPLEDRRDGPARVLGALQRWQVFASDASQDAVFRFVETAKKNSGLVVQGPPGTGKSQLIANLVGAGIAGGKRILVVCSKRAALDVVAARHDAIGLREPIAVVHDVSRDRNALCASMEATLSHLDDHLSGADERRRRSTRARREHDQALSRLSARLDHAHQAFSLLATSQDGIPPLAQLQERALDDDGRRLPDMTPVAADITEDELLKLLPRIETLAHVTAPVAAPHPLAIRGRWEELSGDEADEVFARVEDIRQIAVRARGLQGATMTPEESREHDELWDDVEPLVDMLEYDRALLSEFLLFWTWTEGEIEGGAWHQVMATLKEARQELQPVPYELVVAPRQQLTKWLDDLKTLSKLQQQWHRFFRPAFWRLRKVPGEILDHCKSWSDDDSTLPVDVAGLCRQALKWQELNEAMPRENPLFDFGFSGRLEDIDLAIESLQRQHNHTRHLHHLRQALSHRGAPYEVLPDLGPELADPAREVDTFRAAVDDRLLSRLFDEFAEVLDELRQEGGLDPRTCDAIEAGFLDGEFQQIIDIVTPFLDTRDDVEQAVEVDSAMGDLPSWARYFLKQWRPPKTEVHGPGEDALLAVERAWLALLSDARDPSEIEASLLDPDYLDRLGDDLERCREIAGRGVHGQYSERIAEMASSDERRKGLQQLASQLARRRNKPSLRQLTERFWDRGLSLIRPVWFCSPDAASALFPLQADLFDMVIFDEASQCRVESALGALMRSDLAIIAGDDQQMPPSQFFRTSIDVEDEDSTLLATPSILQLGRATFTNTTLRWHYRSLHEELIAFSNRAFYGGRLITAPVAGEIDDGQPEGLHLRQVDGIWENQTNQREAREVVDLVEELLSLSLTGQAAPSVGVVTFNRKQAETIEFLLDERAASRDSFRRALRNDEERPDVEQLFVRNLENVQGDQRDVIILCTGYGPTKPGGPIHARFGPISQQGGEKRLNVAITRARKGIWVVTSMSADTLEVDHTRHPGPKLLRAYLGFVEAHTNGDQEAITKWLDEAHALGGGRGVTGQNRRIIRHDGPGERVRRELIEALQTRDLIIEKDVGLGSHRLDLTVRPDSDMPARLGIDCTVFLTNPDSLARDVHAPAFWQRLGWTVLRVSPRMWLSERQETLDEISRAVERVYQSEELGCVGISS